MASQATPIAAMATSGESSAHQPSRHVSLPWILFWFGLLLFVFGRMTQAILPSLVRSEPTEVDDAYRYLAQAKVMADCLDGGCPALRSIEAQLALGEAGSQVAFNRLRTDIHLFTYFHPFFSLALNGARSLGLDSSPAYVLVTGVLGLMVVVAIAVWLGAVWGPVPAGIALILLAFYPLPGQGLHFVPWTIALGWAAWTWAVILLRRTRLYAWMPLFWVASLATHPMGLFFVAAALLMILGMNLPEFDLPGRRLFIVGGVLIAGRLVLATILPSFGLSGDVERFYPEGVSYREALVLGMTDLKDWVGRWGATFWRPAAAGALVVIGVLAAAPLNRRRVWVTAGALLAGLAASLVYYHPVHGSTAMGRMWGCLALFLSGAVGSAIVFTVSRASAWLSQARRGQRGTPSHWLAGVGILVLAALVFRALATNVRYSFDAYPSGIARAAAKGNLRIGGETAFAPILALRPDQAALYLDEVSLYAGLASGTSGSGAIFLPILPEAEEARARVIAEASPVYAVGLSPIARLPRLERGAIALSPGESLRVTAPAGSDYIWDSLLLENPGPAVGLEVDSDEGGVQQREGIAVPAGYSGWLPLPAWLAGRSDFTLTATPESGRLRMGGLRLEGDDTLQWPWERGIRLRTEDPDRPGETVSVDLSLDAFAEAVDLPLDAVSDEYSILVARIGR